MAATEKKILGWCVECEWILYEGTEYDPEEHDWICPKCEHRLTPFSKLPAGIKSQVKAVSWFRSLREQGLHGFSPGGACQRLGCDRSMVDKLVGMGVLEKSVYDQDGIHMIFISERSIKKAVELKKQTGKWTGGKNREQ